MPQVLESADARPIPRAVHARLRGLWTIGLLAGWLGVAVLGGCRSNAKEFAGLTDAEFVIHVRQADDEMLRTAMVNGESSCGSAERLALVKAVYWMRRQDWSAALEKVSQVTPVGELRPLVLLLAGEALYRNGSLGAALPFLNTLTSEFPDDVDGYRCLAAVCYDLSAMTHAEAALEQIIRLAPADFRPHHMLGHIKLDFKQFAAAQAYYARAHELCEATAAARLPIRQGLSRAYIGGKNYAQHLQQFPAEEADPLIQTNRAEAYWGTGDLERSTGILNQVLQANPGFEPALLLSARIAADAGDPARAVELLTELLKRQPHHVAARNQLALAQRQAGDLPGFTASMKLKEQSQALFDRLGALNQDVVDHPERTEARRELAEVCRQLGKDSLAAMWDRTAQELEQPRVVPVRNPSAR